MVNTRLCDQKFRGGGGEYASENAIRDLEAPGVFEKTLAPHCSSGLLMLKFPPVDFLVSDSEGRRSFRICTGQRLSIVM